MKQAVSTVFLIAATACMCLPQPLHADGIVDLYDLSSTNGTLERPGLTLGVDGLLYGGTQSGGAGNSGTLFSFDPAGGFSTVYAFAGPDGAQPFGGLVADGAGNFYGTTSGGGANKLGTVFELSAVGLVVLHSFGGADGSSPLTGVTLDSAGDIFGATNSGGPKNFGTVFEITAAGAFKTLYAFSGPDGETPSSTLAIGADGSVYGTAKLGGASNRGLVFKLAADGTFTILHSFVNLDGASPKGTLMFAPDGNLYGTTSQGGSFGVGTVFEISTTGALTTLHSFSSLVDGQTPGPLMLGNDGQFYGTTSDGGPSRLGTVYSLTHAGVFTLIYNFTGLPDGATPSGSLAETTSGTIYGSTLSGGANGDGMLFSFDSLGAPDTTPPTTTIAVAGPQTPYGEYSGAVTVTLSSVDTDVAATYFAVDGASPAIYTAPFGVSGEGSHTVSYWSVDWANNHEAPKTASVVIDSIPPVTTVSLSGAMGNAGWYLGPVTVTLSGVDAGGPVTTSYTLDGSDVQSYTAPFVVSAQGTHALVFWSTDAAGNVEAANTASVNIDSVAPQVSFSGVIQPNAAGWYNASVSMPFTSVDGGSGIASVSVASPLQFTTEGAGQSITVTAIDNAGNSAQVSSPVVNIDMTPPSTTASVTGALVTLSATDALSGVAATSYTIDGGTAARYSAPFTVTGSGTHTVSYWSSDVAGNVEAAHSVSVTVASTSTGPVLTSMTPSSASIFGCGTWVTLKGSGFQQDALVRFGYFLNETEYDGPSKLRIYVWPIELWFSQKSTPVSVVNPDGKRSNSLTFTVNGFCW